jgi:16S rRNA (guanine966-N2)-methyltransferase
MRIIGGEFRSRLIAMPKGVDIRPTQDKVRQAIFNLLADVSGKRVLELFAGSGAFGIEAISRGSSYAAFVDNNFRCVETIQANLVSLHIDMDYYDIIRANALSVLPRLAKDEKKFDLVFMDPPYHLGMAKKCLINIDSYDILAPNSRVVVEHFKKDLLETGLKSIRFEKERRYGDVVITIFRKVAHEKRKDSDIPGNI